MHNADAFLRNLALVMAVAALMTVLFQRLHQPVVLGYIIAGLVIGPHVPVPLVADEETIRTLSEMGVILLMFSIGLELSVRRILKMGGSALITTTFEVAAMLWLGYLIGSAMGWSAASSLFLGGAISISSTTIVAKTFGERKVGGTQKELVYGILVVEDVFAVLLMTVLTTVAAGRGLSAGALLSTTGKLLAFLFGIIAAGLLLVPRFIRFVVKLKRPETLLVASVGVCFGISQLAHNAGYSVALGAFIAGVLVAESGEHKAIEPLIIPVRDIFAAIFFVAVGMQLDPVLIAKNWQLILLLTFVVIFGKVFGVSFGVFLTGRGIRNALRAGLSLAQIGELGFIIAELGVRTKVASPDLYVIAVTVSALTTLSTPWLIRASDPVANWVDRKLPKRLQTFATLYGSWLEELRKKNEEKTLRSNRRKTVRYLFLDVFCILAIVIGTRLLRVELQTLLTSTLHLDPRWARRGMAIIMLVVAGPFVVNIVRHARRLGAELAEAALPVGKANQADLAATPRRMFVLSLQLACLLVVGVALVAMTQPFLPWFPGPLALIVLLVVSGVLFWRRTADLQGHVRAGAEVLAEALMAHTAGGEHDDHAVEHSVEATRELLPGLGAPTTVSVGSDSGAVGQSLRELNLRGRTGATVLALRSGDEPFAVPDANRPLLAGDVLVLAGTQLAVAQARQLLTDGGTSEFTAPVEKIAPSEAGPTDDV